MKIVLGEMPKSFEAALKACRSYFWLAAFFSALVNILYLAPTIYMMQVYDRVVPTSGVLTLIWLTVIVCIALATLAALDAMRAATAWRIWGGACMSFGLLASGRTDAAFDTRLKLWDFAPFRPIIEGAGGVITDWEGRPIDQNTG